MKRLGLLAALVAVLFAAKSYACDAHKEEGKGKAPQAQTTTTTAPTTTAQGNSSGK